MVTEQVASSPLQAPSQPVNVAFAAGVAVSVTVESSSGLAVHVVRPLPHWIPPPLTEPGPVTVTLSVIPVPLVVNVAVTLFAPLIVTVQVVAAPLHAPPQLVKAAPVSGVAVRVTVEPAVWFTVQFVAPEPQLIPPPVTVPSPVTETPSGKSDAGGFGLAPVNEAWTLFAELIVTEQVGDVPAHAPAQPLKLAPDPGCAVRVTVVPAAWSALQLEPPADVQAMLGPATVPLPVTETVSANVVADFVKVALTAWSSLIVTVQLGPLPPQAPPQLPNV
jgi:hypothetical protein